VARPALAAGIALGVLLSAGTAAGQDTAQAPHFSVARFTAGVLASLAVHESAHVLTSLAMGGHPSFGFNQARPVIHSGINVALHPDRQFAFSAAGMTTQLILDEVILDGPHDDNPAGEFEKGVLASGMGTVLFYFTVGRNASVSDVQQMSQTTGISKWTLTAMFGSVATLDFVRVLTRQRYAHFFAAPEAGGRVAAGMAVEF
jgi:hypothetical protein